MGRDYLELKGWNNLLSDVFAAIATLWVPKELTVSRLMAYNLTVNHQKRLFLTVNCQRCGVILTVTTFQGISNLLISADLNWIKTGACPQKHSLWILQHLTTFLYLKYFEILFVKGKGNLQNTYHTEVNIYFNSWTKISLNNRQPSKALNFSCQTSKFGKK